ncbi:hypothetical protein BJY04DRAFT_213745 [Aspergillus karnatakaensis]|uniref:uncharacterized protein n=1 Tax=Aspergillus karnatakaensis TaxID=1810916 RepID=UPI003CCD6A14
MTLGIITFLATLTHTNFTWRAQPDHAQSFPMTIIDPDNNPTQEETYTIQIPLQNLNKSITDEEILARFSKGYFGGWMFSPERWVAPFVQGVVEHDVITNSRSDPRPDGYEISTTDSLSTQHIAPLGALKHRGKVFPYSKGISRPERSFVEYAGLTKGRSLAASHRFEVARVKLDFNCEDQNEGEGYATIVYSHVRSNPLTGGRVYSRPMTAMHVVYAHLLFADGVREVLGGIDDLEVVQ